MTMVVKLLILGDGAVGKTAIRQRYLGQGFRENYTQTIGADFAPKYIEMPKSELNPYGMVKTQIWDLVGQPSFEEVRSKYYLGSHGALLVFDITRNDTYENIINWQGELIKNISEGVFPRCFSWE
ncbi:MAG: Rab family GTPase [Candidatus Hodarchaeales archaeon]|jgi:small GTP-binding protein